MLRTAKIEETLKMTERNNPFSNYHFLNLLESTGCVNHISGWIPKHIKNSKSLLMTYIKEHSYGEYIFDWEWANLYQHLGLNYYPKLIHAIPFTPVISDKVIGDKSNFKSLAQESFDYYQINDFSSEHYLFINDEEKEILKNLDFEIKLTHQYHFYNHYDSFDHFLAMLKKNKRKNIKKERRMIHESKVDIKHFTKEKLNKEILKDFYRFYISTIHKKSAYAYLNQEFFTGLDPNSTLLITAYQNKEVIAMALFFYSTTKLYGRYWGISPQLRSELPFLHFELCYYQGIEFCISKNLKIFEAGAQGEHKLLRGFKPVIINSAHHLKNKVCFDIVKKHIHKNNKQTLRKTEILKSYLPFK